jgi:alkanesulfonate monooxygenase SsuD/methylene tetrahydromethanopterin reductase-like flavin-dependent oxidoreductase (luciferase family)
MEVGLHLGYQNITGMPDHEFFRRESRYAVEGEAMGFDFTGPVEHHFTDYAACPDPFQMLAWVAAQTKKIKLLTGACILPWNNPLRVVEQAIELDILSEGRYILGMGRGAARREYRSFNADMADSREMFDEAAEIIIAGVETGIVEANTKFYKIPRTEVRPRPFKSFKDRTVMVTMSPSSVEVATKLGIQALRFSQGDWRTSVPEINKFRADFQKLHGRPSPPFIISDFVLCFEDKKKVEEYCDVYFKKMFLTVSNHYEFGGEHFKNLPSYGAYLSMGNAQEAIGGPEKMYKAMIGGNMIGTPEELIEHHRERVKLVGDYSILANFSFGGLPYELVDESMKTFVNKVMPALKN